jgi:hypothetical protein
VNAFSTATTSRLMVKDCSGSPAGMFGRHCCQAPGRSLPARAC